MAKIDKEQSEMIELERLKARVASLERELNRQYRIEQVLIAAGYITDEDVKKATDIVLGLPEHKK